MSSGMKRFLAGTLLATSAAFLILFLTHVPIVAAARGAAAGAQAAAAASSGAASFADKCSICHGELAVGDLPAFPPLAGIKHRMNDQQIADIVHNGKDRMPGFPDIQGEELKGILNYLGTAPAGAAASAPEQVAQGPQSAAPGLGSADAGKPLFQQNCAFCHGRDALGGESGPDLTASQIVLADVNGDKISEVVRNGRPAKKMPSFNFSASELANLTAFIHAQVALAGNHKGDRRGVAVADLQTGNAEAGKQYFNGAGTCAKCHSATGDLAGIASKLHGLQLEQRMLYPENVKSKVTVTLPTGKSVTGTLVYLDEFTVALREADGTHRSWPLSRVKYRVDAPAEAHAEMFPKYTDDDIHNLMAYLQTLK